MISILNQLSTFPEEIFFITKNLFKLITQRTDRIYSFWKKIMNAASKT